MIENTSPKKQVLFLCTGNYYRSRFAEIYFNHKMAGTRWTSISRGLNLDHGNYSPISYVAVEALAKIGIHIENPRFPKEAEHSDLENSDIIICMNRNEHEIMMKESFPQYAEKAIYWVIADVYEKDSSSEVPKIINDINNLVKEIA